MRPLACFAALSSFVAVLAAQTPASQPTAGTGPRSVELSAMDTKADPCVDFYQYACGAWMAHNPIPADQARWSRFDELAERNRAILRDILEQAAPGKANRSPVEQKVGDYYASCMDEQAINAKGKSALQPELDRIAAISDKSALVDEIAHLHSNGISALFVFDSTQDFKNSTQVIAEIDQGGLGLPDRDYYLKTDSKSTETRKQYLAHITKMFELLGSSAQQASSQAQAVMQMETELAKGSLDRVSRRDPVKVYHKVGEKELVTLTPSLGWPKYFREVNAPPVQSVNVTHLDFLKAVENLLASTDLDRWKTYLTWRLVHADAPMLSTPFVDENFHFYGQLLTGAKELRPRWKRCVDATDRQLGEALGQKYVERAFGPASKQSTLNMVKQLEAALGQDIQRLSWMTPATKQKATDKLHEITNKIGYPDKWRDYSSVRIVRGDALGNFMRADNFEFHRQTNKIGKPVDKGEWLMTPPTVNAYYDPQMNNINFPAGILQLPFYSASRDNAVNFGGIGIVIGHELTHGFDDEGRQFDGSGNLHDWWSPKDAAEFEKRAQCVVDEYSSFTAVDDLKLNGKLTLGENTADNGGARISLMAMRETPAAKSGKIDGFTPEQRFFLGFGQVWCENRSDEVARLLALTNPHSPGRYRVNGVLRNMPEFDQAFSCKAGQPMAPPNQCRVW